MQDENAKSLQQLRVEARLTQEELARQAGVSLVNIQKWESGTRVPSIVGVQALSKVLGDAVFHARYGTRQEKE